MLNYIYLFVTLLSLSICLNIYAHGDLHEKINTLSLKIIQDKQNANNYFDRAKLYLQHYEYLNAANDLVTCKQFGFSNKMLPYYFAESYFGLKKYEEALESIDKYLIIDVKNVNALRLKGKVLYEYECFEMAAKNFEAVTFLSLVHLPENYLETATAWFNTNTEYSYEKAIATLQAGINAMGKLPVFFDKKVEFSLADKNYENAIVFQTELLNLLQRKEHALVKRAEIFMLAKNFEAGKADLKNAKLRLNKLSNNKKKLKANNVLLLKINDLKNKL